ncbi:MAG TPA: haloacid dehalogenase type II [Stellaceae bacterium]|nr:haloacid dehalogenase type II [Stellaceae bacterium]
MRLTDFKVLTFDCYGTLIDWETGIFTALQPLLTQAGVTLPKDKVLEIFAQHESRQQTETPSMVYPELLAAVHRRLATLWGVTASDLAHRSFGQSVPEWPVFIDSAASLQYLKKYYKLVILSNVDRASFKASNVRLQVEFDAIYTAQDIGSYKPDPRNFDYLLSHLAEQGVAKGDILHTAQSLFHDHGPANRVGLASAWIDRRYAEGGWGATMPPPKEIKLDFHFNSMNDLVRAHQEELRATA